MIAKPNSQPDPSTTIWAERLLWSGVLAPLVVAAAIIEESLVQKSVNWHQQSISLLSEGPRGDVLRLGLAAGGLLVILFAWSLHRIWRDARAVARAQGAIGTGLIFTGVFIQQGLAPKHSVRIPSPWGPLTVVGIIHIVAAGVLYGAAVWSCRALLRSLPKIRRWQAAWRYCAATAVAMSLLVPAFVVSAGIGGPAGLLERLAGLLAAVWEVWFGGLLLTRGWPRHAPG